MTPPMNGTRPLVVALLLSLGALAGCPGGGASEMLDTAQLEEKQENVEHARQLYEAIVRDYPGSPEAAKAAERLTALKGP